MNEGVDRIPKAVPQVLRYALDRRLLLLVVEDCYPDAAAGSAEIEHAGFLGSAEDGENDDEKRALAKVYLDEKGYEVSGRFERIGDLDEDLLRDDNHAVVGDATLFTLNDQSQVIIDHLVLR